MSQHKLYQNGLALGERSGRHHETAPFVPGLNGSAGGVTSWNMRKGILARLRALILLAAFSLGLAGQAFAFVPMAMAQHESQSVVAAMHEMTGCPECAGDESRGPSKALMPVNCALALCSGFVSPAILPQGLSIPRTHHDVFLPVAAKIVRGISIRPDIGPPRTLHSI